MQSYAIIYRAGNALQRVLVEKVIKSFPCWAHILDEQWFVKTNHTANQIYDMINPLVGLNGRVIVVALRRNAAWRNLNQSDYIFNNL